MSASIKLNGAAELVELLKDYPSNVTQAAARAGLRTAGKKFRASLNIPQVTGKLNGAVKVRLRKQSQTSYVAHVGLGKIKGERGVRYYYKTLEMNTRRGGPLRPFLYAPFQAQQAGLAQMIVDETRKAVYKQAARINRKVMRKAKG